MGGLIWPGKACPGKFAATKFLWTHWSTLLTKPSYVDCVHSILQIHTKEQFHQDAGALYSICLQGLLLFHSRHLPPHIDRKTSLCLVIIFGSLASASTSCTWSHHTPFSRSQISAHSDGDAERRWPSRDAGSMATLANTELHFRVLHR